MDEFILILALLVALLLFTLASITSLIRAVRARKLKQFEGNRFESDTWSLDGPTSEQEKSRDHWVLS